MSHDEDRSPRPERTGHFSEGQEEAHDEGTHGHFSEGQEAAHDEAAHGHFSEGQDREEGHSSAKEHVGHFSEGQENPPPKE